MTCSTRVLVLCATGLRPDSTWETVVTETPACTATSVIPTGVSSTSMQNVWSCSAAILDPTSQCRQGGDGGLSSGVGRRPAKPGETLDDVRRHQLQLRCKSSC